MPHLNALRIDNLTVAADGRLVFAYTEGTAPLPLAAGPDGLEFSSRVDFIEQMREWEATLGAREKLFILLADAIKNDPTLRTTTLNAQRGRNIVVDYTSPAKIITT